MIYYYLNGTSSFSSSGWIAFIFNKRCLADWVSIKGSNAPWALIISAYTSYFLLFWCIRGSFKSYNSGYSVVVSSDFYVGAVYSYWALKLTGGILDPYPFHSIRYMTVPAGAIAYYSPFLTLCPLNAKFAPANLL